MRPMTSMALGANSGEIAMIDEDIVKFLKLERFPINVESALTRMGGDSME